MATPKITQAQRLDSLRYMVRDAEEALQAAVSLRNWAGVRKYATQIEKHEREIVDTERLGDKRSRRGNFSNGRYQVTAGERFGRGRLPP